MNRFAASRLLLSYIALICGLFVTHRPREDNLWWALYATQRSLLWNPKEGEEYDLKYRENGNGDPEEIRLRATGKSVRLTDNREFQRGKDFDNFKCDAFEFEAMPTTAGEIGSFLWILFSDLKAPNHLMNDGMIFSNLQAIDGAYDYAMTTRRSSEPTIDSFETLHPGKIESLMKREDPPVTSIRSATTPGASAHSASISEAHESLATATTDIARAGTAITSNVQVKQSAGGKVGKAFDVAVKN